MKVYFYIKHTDIEYLNKILKDFNNLNRMLEISFNPMNDAAMVSLSVEDFISLNDREVFATLISL